MKDLPKSLKSNFRPRNSLDFEHIPKNFSSTHLWEKYENSKQKFSHTKKDGKTLTAKTGDKVKIEYTGTLDDGTVFDSNVEDGNLLEFEVGGGQVIKGFDDAILGMKEGEEKQFSISPADAYGEHDPTLIQNIPKEIFPPGAELAPGLLFEAGLPTGEKVPALITSVDERMVLVDLNHPLAGKKLNFKIKLSAITSS